MFTGWCNFLYKYYKLFNNFLLKPTFKIRMGGPWVLHNVGGVMEYDLYVDWSDLDRLQYRISGMHTSDNDLHRIVCCILDDIYELWNNDM